MVAHGTAGIHVLGGFASVYTILSEVEHFAVLKSTDDSAFLFSEARKINPRLLTIHRNIHLVSYGLKNCPDGYGLGTVTQARALADSWFQTQINTWEARNLLTPGLVTWYEAANECGAQPSDWENAFWIRILDLADSRGLCMSVFSDSYGTPEVDQFVARSLIFDRILSGPRCKNGERHIISLHVYGNTASGPWIWGRWLLFRDALLAIDPKYAGLRFAFTEFGVTNAQNQNDGRGSADCGRAAQETADAVKAYRAHPEIVGFMLYSFGSGTEWLDLQPCVSQIAAVLQ
jgi:hypothetical protein